MEKSKFHRLFKTTGPAVLPVIHVKSEDQAVRNIQLVINEGSPGVFLINHNFSYTELVPILINIRSRFPYLWLGVNFLGVTGDIAFKILGDLIKTHNCHIDAYWADNACIDERTSAKVQEKADKIQKIRQDSGWEGLYFGGTAFKCQRHVPIEFVQKAASIAIQYMDVVLTSGQGTGIAAHLQKIINMQKGCEGKTLGIASGITPENALTYAPYIDCFLVATGISVDFYNLDATKLRSLMSVCRSGGTSYVRTDAWYLNKIAPNTKGAEFAWLDPTSVYLDGKAFGDLTNDIISQLDDVNAIDLIAGLDAMGFPLAAAIATKLNKGLLVIRKSPKLCVDVDIVTYSCYSGSGKKMEMRKDAFQASTRVLIVDQWIETGGTMKGAIELVEKQNGIVVGLVTICMERNEQTLDLAKKYKVVHVVPHELQQAFDEHKFLGSQYKN